MSSHVDLINQKVQTPGDFIQEENLKRARIAGREYEDLTNKVNQKSLITWGRVSTFFQTISLVALVFTMVAPFFIKVPSWSFGVMVGGSLVIGIPLSIKQGKEEEIKKNRLNFLNFLSVFQEMNKHGNTSLHLACEADLPSQDPRLQCERDPVFRGTSTKDVRRVVDKYGLVESPGDKFLVSHRFAKTENSMYQDIERNFKKYKTFAESPEYTNSPEYLFPENPLTKLAPNYLDGIENRIDGFKKYLRHIGQKLIDADDEKYQKLLVKLEKARMLFHFDRLESNFANFNQCIDSAIDNLKKKVEACRNQGIKSLDKFISQEIEPLEKQYKELEEVSTKEYLETLVKAEQYFLLKQLDDCKKLDSKWEKSDLVNKFSEAYQETLNEPDLFKRFAAFKRIGSALFKEAKRLEEMNPLKVLEKCKKKAAFLRNLINENHIYSFLTELTAIEKRLEGIAKDENGLDLDKLKTLKIELYALHDVKVLLRLNNFNKDSFFKRELEPYFEPPKKLNKWEKIEFKSIDAALIHYDKEIISKERRLHLIVIAVSIALVVMYSLLKMDPWMNLMCELGALAFFFGLSYANGHIHRLRKEIRVLKMRQYFVEHPEMMNRLPPLPQVKEKLDQLKRLDIPTFTGYEQISRVLVDL